MQIEQLGYPSMGSLAIDIIGELPKTASENNYIYTGER